MKKKKNNNGRIYCVTELTWVNFEGIAQSFL